MASWFASAQRHHSEQPRPARAAALRIEDDIGPTTLRSELRAHALERQHCAATEAGGPGTRHRSPS